MRVTLAGLSMSLALMAWAPAILAAEPEGAETVAVETPQLLIGIDLSKSNPLVEDPVYAARVADRVAAELAQLPLRTHLMVRTFGVYDSSSNHLKIDQVISSRAKPEDVADGIRALIANIPTLVKEGKLEAQMYTNIIPFLETMAPVLDCKAGPTRVILLTDGAEDSEYGKLTRSGGALPAPQKRIFSRCEELVILGLGQGLNSPKTTERFRAEWGGWAKKAGFRKFSGYYDW